MKWKDTPANPAIIKNQSALATMRVALSCDGGDAKVLYAVTPANQGGATLDLPIGTGLIVFSEQQVTIKTTSAEATGEFQVVDVA